SRVSSPLLLRHRRYALTAGRGRAVDCVDQLVRVERDAEVGRGADALSEGTQEEEVFEGPARQRGARRLLREAGDLQVAPLDLLLAQHPRSVAARGLIADRTAEVVLDAKEPALERDLEQARRAAAVDVMPGGGERAGSAGRELEQHHGQVLYPV